MAGISLILLSVLAGYGMSFLIGYKTAESHSGLVFLMMGIGVDDMFVLCNAIDQTPLHLPPDRRVKLAMRHAGPSMTITSLTNAVAFFSGSTSSILAVNSFCFFCGITVTLMYVSMMTIFLPIVYWDSIRVARRRGELCGLCCCREDSILFCRGRLLSEPQKKFSAVGKYKSDLDAPKQSGSKVSQGRVIKPSR